MTTNSIGQRIDYLIHEVLNISQRGFAHAIGINESNISHIIHDERPVGTQLLIKISNKYGVTADWLLGISDRMYNEAEYTYKNGDITDDVVCKVCGNKPLRHNEYDMLFYSDYCPFCGAYMRKKNG